MSLAKAGWHLPLAALAVVALIFSIVLDRPEFSDLSLLTGKITEIRQDRGRVALVVDLKSTTPRRVTLRISSIPRATATEIRSTSVGEEISAWVNAPASMEEGEYEIWQLVGSGRMLVAFSHKRREALIYTYFFAAIGLGLGLLASWLFIARKE